MEKILKIEETSFKLDGKSYTGYNGFIITTDEQTIKLGISNSQQCCEDWGYLMSEDDMEDFIGSEIISIKIVDDALKPELVPQMYEGNAMFINIETTNGLLQFVAYNDHNGCYSHSTVVVSKQLNDYDSL